jgi:outer membrane protein assembly factor BamD (BamD/ComL family)
MKKTIFLSFLVILFFSIPTFAQKQIKPEIDRDPVLENDAKHNLEVSWQYFKLKKAYKAVILRFEETYAAYPDFSKIDEFLYLAGMSSMYLSDGKGKQKLDYKTMSEDDKKKFAPEKLREDAINYFSIIKDKYPTSQYIGETEKNLKLLQDKK